MAESVVDFTTGSIVRKILIFSIPLFLGNLFQQLYNAADTLIVGNFLGSDALAAVSSSGSLIFMMVGFFNGMAVGAGVVISHALGAGDRKRLERAIHTDIAFGCISGVVLTFFAVIFTPHILRWISTPDNLLPLSTDYFRIYSAGIFFSVLYNILMGIMNALGDSKHPLYYLMISSAVNIVLDLLFIGVMGMGVGSAAFATIISQAASSVLCLIHLMKGDVGCRVSLKAMRITRGELRAIVSSGLPSGLQNSIVGFANTVVQASVNTFPAAAIAGFGVYAKIEGFVLLPITTISLALTTCIAQTVGSGKLERMKKGARSGLLLDIISGEAVGALLFIFAPFLFRLFSSDSDVIAFGVRQARIEAFFYFLPALSHGTAGILRGVGKAFIPMLVLLGAWCITRVVFIRVLLFFVNDVAIIYIAYPVTWLLSSAVFVYFLFSGNYIPERRRYHD
ncbi:MAG: MATE family efflux transporter [Spirochaetes bacterium]|uniref:MATE family efflux transporter n=1 Tax=Candidatus Ornithospirochaeta stercoripullorum TaxID=2840899 RepID=A0A9D9DXU5_9SPIO|nr:MATE family efflux transporter [Candidatus Ornithospirochaeta stercoripullorum]